MSAMTSVPAQSPPVTPAVATSVDEPRATLNQLAGVLARSNDRRLLAEYLRLRRALR